MKKEDANFYKKNIYIQLVIISRLLLYYHEVKNNLDR